MSFGTVHIPVKAACFGLLAPDWLALGLQAASEAYEAAKAAAGGAASGARY